jgi:hypothetical protein
MKRLGLFFLVAMAFVPRLAQADGGIVRARETRGPFLITIFTPSELFIAAPMEVSVMVQDRETNQVVLDAVVELSLTQPNESKKQNEIGEHGPMTGHTMRGDSRAMHQPSIIRVTRGQGTNKLLYSTNVVLPLMGDWILHVSVRHDRGEATVSCALPVGIPPGRLVDLWRYLAVVPAAIALFAINQWLRRRSPSQTAQMNSSTIAAL